MLLGENSISNDTVSTSLEIATLCPLLSVDPKALHNRTMSMGAGIFLLVFSLAVVVLDSSNFLAFGLAFFVLMAGIMLVMMGAVTGMEKKKDPDQARTEIVREVVKVRCKYCNALNFETSQRCSNCGGQL
jgi:uncharacterized membrane protein YhaH (DUF805 family)